MNPLMNRVLIQQIISKYPPEVITKLEEAKGLLRPWSIKSLRKAICHYVTVQENVQRYVSSVNTNVKGQHFVPRQLALLPRIFCKSNHFNIMCDKFTTLTERKQILSQQRCFVCLKVGHVLKDCPISQKKVCCHCGRKGYHNRCLCPEKSPRQETDALLVTNQVNYLLRIMLVPLVLLMRVWVYNYS